MISRDLPSTFSAMASTTRHSASCGLAIVLVGAATALSGCTSSYTRPEAPLTASIESQVQSSAESAGPEWAVVQLGGLPFELGARVGAFDGAQVVEPTSIEIGAVELDVIGRTQAPSSGMPGPSVRTLLSDGTAFGAQLQPPELDTVEELSDIPSVLGIINGEGVFEEDPTLTEDMAELAGSNEDGLYFEPQDASSNGTWVVWREGSAGMADALPTLNTDDWRVVGWDRETGRTTELASGFLLHGDRFAPRGSWSIAPSTDGSTTYFEAVVPSSMADSLPGTPAPITSDGGNVWTQVIARVANTNPGEVTLVANGTSPVVTGTGPLWIDNQRTLVGEAAPDLEVSTPGWGIGAISTDGDQVAVTATNENGEGAWILVWSMREQRLVAAVNALSAWAQTSISGDVLVWGNGTYGGDGSMFMWDAEGLGISNIGDAPGISIPYVNGRILAIPSLDDSGAVIWSFAKVP